METTKSISEEPQVERIEVEGTVSLANPNPAALLYVTARDTSYDMILSFDDVQKMGHALGKNLLTKEQLIKAVEETTSFSIADVSVSLDPRLLVRLKSRCLDKANWERWLAEVVTKQLHDYAGY